MVVARTDTEVTATFTSGLNNSFPSEMETVRFNQVEPVSRITQYSLSSTNVRGPGLRNRRQRTTRRSLILNAPQFGRNPFNDLMKKYGKVELTWGNNSYEFRFTTDLTLFADWTASEGEAIWQAANNAVNRLLANMNQESGAPDSVKFTLPRISEFVVASGAANTYLNNTIAQWVGFDQFLNIGMGLSPNIPDFLWEGETRFQAFQITSNTINFSRTGRGNIRRDALDFLTNVRGTFIRTVSVDVGDTTYTLDFDGLQIPTTVTTGYTLTAAANNPFFECINQNQAPSNVVIRAAMPPAAPMNVFRGDKRADVYIAKEVTRFGFDRQETSIQVFDCDVYVGDTLVHKGQT